MTTPIPARQVNHTTRLHAAAPSFGQRVLAYWRKMTCTDATAVTSRNSIASRTLRSSTHNSASVLTEIQAIPPAVVDEVITADQRTNLTLAQVLETWVNAAPTDERSSRNVAKAIILNASSVLQEDGSLLINGDVDLSDMAGLTCLPDNLCVSGNLFLVGCTGLIRLPNNLRVDESINLTGCISLSHLPNNLSVGGYLFCGGCTSLSRLSENLSVGGYLNLAGCTELTSIPDNLRVRGHLNLAGCTSLTRLPDNLRIGAGLNLRGCTGLTILPNNFRVGGNLNLSHCTSLSSLSDDLSVSGSLFLLGCTNLTSVSNTLRVDGSLELSGCTSLQRLPERLSVGRDLILNECTQLTHLPNNLSVGGELNLIDCINLDSLPNNLRVGGDLNLMGCTRFTTLPDAIFNLGRNTDGRIRQIFLASLGLSAETVSRIEDHEHDGIHFIVIHPALPDAADLTWEGLPAVQNLNLDASTTCAITLQTLDKLQQPVYVANPTKDSPQQDIPGHIFEFEALLQWYNHSPTNPMTRAPLYFNQLQKIPADMVANLAKRTAD